MTIINGIKVIETECFPLDIINIYNKLLKIELTVKEE